MTQALQELIQKFEGYTTVYHKNRLEDIIVCSNIHRNKEVYFGNIPPEDITLMPDFRQYGIFTVALFRITKRK